MFWGKPRKAMYVGNAHHSSRLGSQASESLAERIRRQWLRARTVCTEAVGNGYICVDIMKRW